MRKKITLLLLAFAAALVVSLIPAQVFAAGTIADAFPDKQFQAYIKDDFGFKATTPMSKAQPEFDETEWVAIHDYKIADLTGIENFHNMTGFLIEADRKLTSADLSQNTKLDYLCISTCKLSSINLGNNTALRELDLFGNELTEIDFSSTPNLESIEVSDNNLTSIDVTMLPNLKTLYAEKNQLTGIDVSKCPELFDLTLSNNKLTGVPDVSQNPNLGYLMLDGNGFPAITEADVKGDDFPYTGSPIEPGIKWVEARDAEGEEVPLKPASCSVLRYLNNVTSGTAFAIVAPNPETGYAGQYAVRFDIKPPQVTGVKVVPQKKGKLKISWSTEAPAAAEADFYQIWYQVKGQKKKVEKVKGIDTNTKTITIPKKLRGKKVTVKVRASVRAGVDAMNMYNVPGKYSKAITKKVKK